MADCIEIVWHRYVLAGDGVKQGLSEKVLQREGSATWLPFATV